MRHDSRLPCSRPGSTRAACTQYNSQYPGIHSGSGLAPDGHVGLNAGIRCHASTRERSHGERSGWIQMGAWSATCERSASSHRSASMAAIQPVPAAVTAWRYTWSWASPHAKTPGMLVAVDPGWVSR